MWAPTCVQALAAAVFSGVLFGYVAYDCMHYLMHRCAAFKAVQIAFA